MTKTFNRFIAIFVALALVVSFIPSQAFATSDVAESGHEEHVHSSECSHDDSVSTLSVASPSADADSLTQYQATTTLTSQGTTFPVHTIKKNVDDNEAMVVLIMGDGFKSDQQEKFLEAAKVRAEALLRVEPYRSYANNINIYAMEVVSNEEGVSMTGSPVDTYLGVLQYNDRDAKFRSSQSDGSADESGNSKYEARAAELKEQVEKNVLTSSTTYNPSVNFVHIVSNKDYYFGQSQNYGTYSFSSLSDSSFPTGSTFVHELSHSVGKLADEYSYSLSGKHNIDDYNGKTESTIRWSKLIGFHGTYIFQGTENGTGVATAAVPQNYCIMKNNGYYTYWWEWASGIGVDAFCEVCKLELAKKIMGFNQVSNTSSLYVALPEITIEHNRNYGGLFQLDNYRIRDYKDNGYEQNDIASKANGKEIEFRTVVQNVDKTKGRNIKVRLTTYKEDGTTVKQQAESEVVKVGHAGVYTYKYYDYGIEKTGERDDLLSYTYERESCQSISVKLTLDNDYTEKNHILGEVIDADTNEVLSTDKDLFNSRSNSNLNIQYIDESTNKEIEHTGGGKIPMKQLTTYNVTHPSSVNGYVYTKNSSTDNKITTQSLQSGIESASQTLQYYFKKVDQSTCDHSKTYTKTAKEASCTEDGTGNVFCSICGKDMNQTTVISKKGHNYVKVEAVAAKCGVAGTSEYQKCSNCGDEQGKTTIEALTHQYENGKCKLCGEQQPAQECQHTGEKTTTVTKEATCSEEGTKTTTCNDCNAVISTETIAKLEHTPVTKEGSAQEASCTVAGKEADTECSVCHTIISTGATLPATGHTEELKLDTAKASTCTEKGKEADTVCKVCNKTVKVGAERPLADHNMQEVEGTAKAATCTEDGKEADTECSVCHGNKTEGAVIKARGYHTFVDGKCSECGADAPECQHPEADCVDQVIKESTCTEHGTMGTWCKDCEHYVITWETDLAAHTYETVAEVPATCTEDGVSEHKVCKVCSHEEGKTTITKLGHDYKDGECSRCGAKDTGTTTVTLVDKSNGNVTLDKTEYKAGDTAKVTITGKQQGNNLQVVKAVKVNGITIKSQSQLLDKTTWAKVNDVYKNKMGGDPTSVEFENLAVELAKGVTVDVAIAENTNIEVEFEELVPVYRLYNSITSEHLFTTNKTEYDKFVDLSKTDGDAWIGEGINWFAPATGNVVHRLYNEGLGAMGRSSHYYTADEAEIANLLTQGWTDDGADNQFMSGGDISIWTCYNEDLGSAHHYTSNESEWRGLSAHGWNLEEDKNGTAGVFKALMSAVS